MFIDTHCHLDFDDFKGNLNEVLQNARKYNVGKIIIPGAEISTLNRACALAEKFLEIYFSVGIHPNESNSFNDEILEIFKNKINHKKCLAVGEIGLDYHYLNENNDLCAREISLQKRVFRAQIELAIAFKKPLIIHTRESNADVVEILKEYENDLMGVVFHCFGGDLSLIGALKCKSYFGIGGVVSFKNAQNLRDSLKKIPLDCLLFETDAPYLAPVPHRGKQNRPEYIPLIAEIVAENLHLDIATLQEITMQNAKNAFGI